MGTLNDGYPTHPVVKVPASGILHDLLTEQTAMISRVVNQREEIAREANHA